jgi:hypothetical protein
MIKTLTDRWVDVDGKFYINDETGRAKVLADFGEDFYDALIAEWGETTKATPDFIKNELFELKNRDLEESFKKRVSGAIETSQGYLMQFDTSDAIKMEGAIKLLEATGAAEGYLTQADDTTVYNVPIDTMKAVLMEMMSAFAACHARKQELRAAIKAAETVEELEAIEITWPL